MDYLETLSPAVRTATIRLVLDVATAKGWSINQLDVSNAFLHGKLKEPLSMYQPAGFVDPEKPHHIFDTFSNYLLDFGFACGTSDSSLFVYHQYGMTLILLLYSMTFSSPLVTNLFLNKFYKLSTVGSP